MNEKHDSKTKSRGAVCGSIRMHGSVGASGEQSPDATRSTHLNKPLCLISIDSFFLILYCCFFLFGICFRGIFIMENSHGRFA